MEIDFCNEKERFGSIYQFVRIQNNIDLYWIIFKIPLAPIVFIRQCQLSDIELACVGSLQVEQVSTAYFARF